MVAGARNVASLSEVDVLAVGVDLSTAAGPAELVQAAVDHHGGVDFLINNVAAVRLHRGGFGSVVDEDWEFAFQTNFMSAVRASRAALPHIVERRGAIVNVSSLNAVMPATAS